jgi:tRNA(fMet)-specific endonuclease VapC
LVHEAASGPKREDLARAYQRLADAVPFFARFRILSFTEAAMVRYDVLRQKIRNVAKNDLRIAAIALENDAIVVTRNLREVQRVPGLTVEDWPK